MLKRYVCALSLCIAMSLPVLALGSNFIKLTEPTEATVIEIIDGNSLIASSNNQLMRVRLIAVDAAGYDDSLAYLNNMLLGKSVHVYPDTFYQTPDGRWNLAYIDSNGASVNRSILSTGHGQLDTAHLFAQSFESFEAAEQYAFTRRFGMWGIPSLRTQAYAEDAVNINTAMASTLRERLGISNTLANEIISYREYNPFNTVEEIKFVTGFTRKIYDENIDKMAVVSNINTVTREGLLSLGDLTSSEVDRIIAYRNSNGSFDNIGELRTEGLIARAQYNQISNFISVSDQLELDIRVPDRLFNVNAATSSELRGLGIPSSQVTRIIDYRRNYSYKTLGELVASNIFTHQELNRWADNLRAYNTNGDYININTATRQALTQLGISNANADLIIDAQGKMTDSRRIPVNLSRWDSQISLYTNINRASSRELYSLHTGMTEELVSAIIDYREYQIFGSNDEIEDFFLEMEQLAMFNQIRDFIVVR